MAKKKTKPNSVERVLKDFTLIHTKHDKKNREIRHLKEDIDEQFQSEIAGFHNKKLKKVEFSKKLQKEFDQVAKEMGRDVEWENWTSEKGGSGKKRPSSSATITIASQKGQFNIYKDFTKPKAQWKLQDIGIDERCGNGNFAPHGRKDFGECHDTIKSDVRVLKDFHKCKDKKCRDKFYE